MIFNFASLGLLLSLLPPKERAALQEHPPTKVTVSDESVRFTWVFVANQRQVQDFQLSYHWDPIVTPGAKCFWGRVDALPEALETHELEPPEYSERDLDRLIWDVQRLAVGSFATGSQQI